MAEESHARRRLEWALDHLTDGFRRLGDEDIREAFAESFLYQVPPESLRATGLQLAGSLKDFAVERVEEAPGGAVAVLAVPSGDRFRVAAAVEVGAPHRMSGLVVRAAPDLRPEPAARSWREFEEKLRSLGSRVSFLAAELVDGQVLPVQFIEPDQRLAVASTFKLYVLGALAYEIEDGSVSWDEELKVRSAHKSLPSGEMRVVKAGSAFPIRHYAEQMMSISDNTATDHILHRVGRKRVEAVQALMGHGDPSVNVPFMSTREVFVLKTAFRERELDAYLDASAEQRRKLLDGSVAKRRLPSVEVATARLNEPRWMGGLEWFASAADLARAMDWLREAMRRPTLRPLERAMSINPGVPFDRTAWSLVGFKGGSEPGVLNMTWLLRRFDDRWFVLTIGLNDEQRPIDSAQTAALAIAAGPLLVQHRKRARPRRLLRR